MKNKFEPIQRKRPQRNCSQLYVDFWLVFIILMALNNRDCVKF